MRALSEDIQSHFYVAFKCADKGQQRMFAGRDAYGRPPFSYVDWYALRLAKCLHSYGIIDGGKAVRPEDIIPFLVGQLQQVPMDLRERYVGKNIEEQNAAIDMIAAAITSALLDRYQLEELLTGLGHNADWKRRSVIVTAWQKGRGQSSFSGGV